MEVKEELEKLERVIAEEFHKLEQRLKDFVNSTHHEAISGIVSTAKQNVIAAASEHVLSPAPVDPQPDAPGAVAQTEPSQAAESGEQPST